MSQNNINYLQCTVCEKRAGWIAVFANLGLAIFKLVVGILSGSKAVIGDSLYSFKDFLTALVVLAGLRVSGKPPDEDHPYGHGKIEFVAIFLISMLVIAGTFFVFLHSVKETWLVYKGLAQPQPKFVAFWAALISVVANYKLSQYLNCVGQRINSPAMLVNARHNHSDSVSSMFVAAAVLLTQFGWHIVDPLVAVIETVDLTFLCSAMMRDSLKGMLDSSDSKNLTRKIEFTAQLVPGVKRVASISVRKAGQSVWIDLIIKIDQSFTLDQGHRISRQVEETIKKRMHNVSHINVILEPYIP